MQSDGELIPCAICGATQTEPLYVKYGYAIGRCTTCGLVYANPRAPAAAILARYSPDYFWKEYLPSLGVIDGKVPTWSHSMRGTPRCSRCSLNGPTAGGCSKWAPAAGSS